MMWSSTPYVPISPDDSSSGDTSKGNLQPPSRQPSIIPETTRQSSYRNPSIAPETPQPPQPLPRQPSVIPETLRPLPANKPGSKRNVDNESRKKEILIHEDDIDKVQNRGNPSGDTTEPAPNALPPARWPLKPLPNPQKSSPQSIPLAQSRLGYKFAPHFT